MSSEDNYQHQNFLQSKPKILGFMILHYGGSYLKESLLSVKDHVDKMVIAFSNNPSQGHRTKINLVDELTTIQKYELCESVLGSKLIWEGKDRYSSETEHRNVRYKYSKEFDYILSIDADEVFEGIPGAIEYASHHSERYYGIDGYLNYFRSHEWMCQDAFRPVRLEKLSANNHLQNLTCPMVVHHFSLCQSRELLEYKFGVFGHASEIRPNYLTEVFDKWSPDNQIEWLHPVSLQIWEKAQPFNKENMPDYLKQHPNHKLLLIT